MSDFEIDARGVTFYREDQTQAGIKFLNCRNVTLRGATIQPLTEPRTQGVIEAIAADGRSYDVKIEKGYRTDLDDEKFFPREPVGYIFEPKARSWKAGTWDLYSSGVERLGPDRFRLHWKQAVGPDRLPVAPGDLLTFRCKGATDIYVGRCAGMRIEDVTIKAGTGFCVHEDGGDGGNYYSYTVTYGPKPRGAATVNEVEPLKQYTPAKRTEQKRFKDSRRFCRLTLDRTLPAEFKGLVSNPAAIGSGYVIRNNTIRHTGYAAVGPWTTQAGALTIAGEGEPDAAPGHRNITIENNRILDCDGVNLMLTSARDVTVKNNQFANPCKNRLAVGPTGSIRAI